MDLKFSAARRVAPTVFACVLAAAMFLPAGHVLARDGGDSYADRDDWQVRDRDDDARDPVVLSFSTVGDSRQDPVASDPTTLPLSGQDKIWLQNTKAWSRIMRSIQSQAPELMFFNGDMIMGYGKASVPTDTSTVEKVVGSDLVKFYTQYAFWRGMATQLLETGTYVVPVPGNHEVQYKAGGKIALVENENAWRANMGDLILDKTRFQNLFNEEPTNVNVGNNGPTDSLTSDQTQLSYSFDFRGSHFVVVNTDPVGHDAHAPTQWLTADLKSARSRGLTHFFVFGHKPAFTYNYSADPKNPVPPAGLDTDVLARNEFWGVIEQYGATYFSGHEHIFHISRPLGSAVQVLVGSGGSPFDAAPNVPTIGATDRFYAWATVKVRRSGRVQITAYGFDDQFGPTHNLQNLVLPH